MAEPVLRPLAEGAFWTNPPHIVAMWLGYVERKCGSNAATGARQSGLQEVVKPSARDAERGGCFRHCEGRVHFG